MAIALAGGSDGNQSGGTSSSQMLSSSSSSAATAAAAGATMTPTTITTTASTAATTTINNNLAQHGPTTDPKKNDVSNSGVDMLGGCSVCLDDQGSEENPLVYCDGCDLSVHQACYGIVKVPSGNWFCKKCECRDTQKEIKCELCPAQDGALKKTETGQWAHVVCALYIPEVRFGNNNTMEPIIIKHIQADRYSKSCYLCQENNNSKDATYGAVMDCHKPSCKQSFHVTCAQSEGLLCEEAGQGSDNLIYCGYCKHHFRKLKAGNRKTSNSFNNSSSSYLDSASDSSQDNDSRCNTKEYLDKSRANKPPTITNLSTNDVSTNNSNSSIAATGTTTIPTTTANNNSNKHDSTKNPPISLTLTLNSSFSNSNTATTTHVGTSQKKRRAPKGNPSSGPTLLAPPGSTTSNDHHHHHHQQPSTALNSGATTINIAGAQDVYNWPDKDPMINNNNINSNNNNNSKSSKKKPTSSTQSTTPSSNKLVPNQCSSLTNYSPQKVGSPNLSATSSSLTSPATSTKSTSSSSTTTVTASSSSSSASSSASTTSNSPSPSLLSPNISNRGSTVRQESPLASNSKTGNLPPTSNRPNQESLTSNNTLPHGQTSHQQQLLLQARINYEDPKIEIKKGATTTGGSTSLLSTAVPMPLDIDPVPSSSSARNFTGQESIPPTKLNTTSTSSNLQFNKQGYSGGEQNKPANSNSEKNKASSITNTHQPTVPPLIIPVPPQLAQNSGSKQPAKSKSGAKSSTSSRKKSTESNEGSKQLPETPPPPPKPKPSRSKKAPVSKNNTVADSSSGATKAPSETKSKGKAKASAGAKPQATASTSAIVDDDATSKAQIAASAPTASKRKSRSASNTETSSSVAPSPAKRSRKKKIDPPAAVLPPSQPPVSTSPEKQSSGLVGLNLPAHMTNHPLPNLTSTSNGLIGTGPLMINTPSLVNNRLMQGMSSLDSQDMGNRYGFSPMISPYANFDHLTAPSLSRSSLSRLFTTTTTTLTDPSHQAGMGEDPTKAFEELRENTWSHLSKCVLDQAQQFDIPSLIGTLYTLRTENEKLFNKVRDLKMKRDELVAMNARLDLPGPMLTQHLNNTSPNFSSVVAGLTNSPKSLPAPSPGSGINKQPLVSVGPYNHLPPGSLGPPNYIDRNSPLVGQTTHSGLSNIKSSSVSTPSPPIGALMAHSGSSNRAGLITVNPPYMQNAYPPPPPPPMNPMNSLGPSPQGSSYYPRQ